MHKKQHWMDCDAKPVQEIEIDEVWAATGFSPVLFRGRPFLHFIFEIKAPESWRRANRHIIQVAWCPGKSFLACDNLFLFIKTEDSTFFSEGTLTSFVEMLISFSIRTCPPVKSTNNCTTLASDGSQIKQLGFLNTWLAFHVDFLMIF